MEVYAAVVETRNSKPIVRHIEKPELVENSLRDSEFDAEVRIVCDCEW